MATNYSNGEGEFKTEKAENTKKKKIKEFYERERYSGADVRQKDRSFTARSSILARPSIM